ncbi:uncharacterized protein LOC135805687 [Sycon ciliatum]|uniref:uncharacterized protein LOC135805687 n=1 Tax=Sycon ciliatum TaxID=27933 RepID=UPI0031F65EEA
MGQYRIPQVALEPWQELDTTTATAPAAVSLTGKEEARCSARPQRAVRVHGGGHSPGVRGFALGLKRMTSPAMIFFLIALSVMTAMEAHAQCTIPTCHILQVRDGESQQPCSAACQCHGANSICEYGEAEAAMSAALESTETTGCPAEVHVCPGVHAVSSEIELVFRSASSRISLIGVNSGATLMAVNATRILHINASSASNSSHMHMSGLTLSHGDVRVDDMNAPVTSNNAEPSGNATIGGGCMALSGHVHVEVQNTTFTDCSVTVNSVDIAQSGGGAVYISGPVQAVFTACRFQNNRLYSKVINAAKRAYLNSIAHVPGSALHAFGNDIRQHLLVHDCVFEHNTVLISNTSCRAVYQRHAGDISIADKTFVMAAALALTGRSKVFITGSTRFSNNNAAMCPPEAWPLDISINNLNDDPSLDNFGVTALQVCISNDTLIANIAVVEGKLWLHSDQCSSAAAATLSGRTTQPTSVAPAATSPPHATRQSNLTTLFMLGRLASMKVPGELHISRLFIWLGGELGLSKVLSVNGFTLALSNQPNINSLVDADGRAAGLSAGTVQLITDGSVILGGTFLVVTHTLNVVNYMCADLTITTQFQVIGIFYLTMINMGHIFAQGTFPLLESFVQKENGYLEFQNDHRHNSSTGNAFSRLSKLTLQGHLGVTFGDTQCERCSLLEFYVRLLNQNRANPIQFIKSPVKPDIDGLQSLDPRLSLNFSTDRYVAEGETKPVSPPLYILDVRVLGIACSLLTTCGCKVCRTLHGCAWFTNSTPGDHDFDCSTQEDRANEVNFPTGGVCGDSTIPQRPVTGSKHSLHEVLSAVYKSKSVRTCCLNDCNGFTDSCGSDLVCHCVWYRAGNYCESYSDNVWYAVGFGVLGILALALILIISLRHYQGKKRTMASVSKWQTEMCTQWMLDAQQLINDGQAFPSAFLIDFQELQILDKIGDGGFGEVYAGKLREVTDVAVKRILDFTMQDTEDLERFRSEASLMCSLHHPNIVQLMGIAVDDQNIHIIMEYMAKGSVKSLLEDPDFKFDWKLRINMALDTVKGMTYLHGKKPPVIHRDLKTHNLLVSSKLTVKIADFGVTKLVYRTIHQEREKRRRESTALLDEDNDGDDNRTSRSMSMSQAAVRGSPADFTFLERNELRTQLLGSSASSKTRSTLSGSGQRSVNSAMNSQRPVSCNSDNDASDLGKHTSWVGTAHWCAPEVLVRGTHRVAYDRSVDVYSFGLILWSLVSCESPYKEYRFRMELMEAVRSGKRPQVPAQCPSAYRKLMERCWSTQPSSRPLFPDISTTLEDMNKYYH